jgi:tetratricopeptide (TPR) repeat protein
MYFARPAEQRYLNGDSDGALALYDQGLALLPGDRSLAKLRAGLVRQQSELRTLLAAAGGPPSTPPLVLLHQRIGMDAVRAADWSVARAHLQLARAGAPDFFEPAFNLALVWLQLGETRSALACYLWAEAHAGGHLPARSRAWVLGRIADQFAAAGEARLAEAARARAVRANRD